MDQGYTNVTKKEYADTNPFSIAFTLLKMKFVDLRNNIITANFIDEGDPCNLFINFESVLNLLSSIKDIENKLLLERDFATILESETFGLAAHYKKFFAYNNTPVRIFFYYTKLDSERQANLKYNEDYRSYYMNKYLYNPKYQMLGNHIKDEIVPRVQKIMEFFPDVYFITANNFDSSLIPMIVANRDMTYKNFIITGDRYDTQYMLRPNFMTHYIKRWTTGWSGQYDFKRYCKDDLLKEYENIPYDIMLHPALYTSALAVRGNKPRSISAIKGIGMKTLVKYIQDGVDTGKMSMDCTSPEIIMNIFEDEEIQEEFLMNFKCTDLESQYAELGTSDVTSVLNQITNRSDLNSLIQLNQTDYRNHPIPLNDLTTRISKK